MKYFLLFPITIRRSRSRTLADDKNPLLFTITFISPFCDPVEMFPGEVAIHQRLVDRPFLEEVREAQEAQKHSIRLVELATRQVAGKACSGSHQEVVGRVTLRVGCLRPLRQVVGKACSEEGMAYLEEGMACCLEAGMEAYHVRQVEGMEAVAYHAHLQRYVSRDIRAQRLVKDPDQEVGIQRAEARNPAARLTKVAAA